MARFGELLRRSRRAAGLTQEELAERAGLSVRGISDLERGARQTPRRDTLDLLVRALDLDESQARQWDLARRRHARAEPETLVSSLTQAGLVGRGREFRILRDAADLAVAGHGRVVMVAGEPGVGKTRLLEDLSAYARARDMTVWWGRCHEGDGAPAFWPWLQIIRAHVDRLAPDVLRRDLGRGAMAIAQVVPEIAERIPGLPQPRPMSPEQARFALFDSLSRFFVAASMRAPLAIALDDLHWADQSSLELLAFLGREIATSRIVMLGSYRDSPVDVTPSLGRLAGELARTAQVEFITLGGLAEPDVGRLIERTVGSAVDRQTVSAVHDRTGGNPFFVTEVSRLMAGAATLADALVEIPPGVRGVLEQRFRLLSESSRASLSAAAVVGREFSLSALEFLSGHSRPELLSDLDEAMRASLIERLSGEVGRYWFSHALVRETLYDALPSADRAAFHKRAGEHLERAHEGEVNRHASMLAYHFLEAMPVWDDGKAASYAVLAGESALNQFAHAEAVQHFRSAVFAIEQGVHLDTSLLCDTLLKLGDASNQAGRYQEAQDAFGRAAEIARSTEYPEALARAAIGAAGLGVIEHGEPRHRQLLDDAVATLPQDERELRSQALARLSIIVRNGEWATRRRELAREAETLARATGDDALLLFALLARHRSLWAPAHREERLAVAREISIVERNVPGPEATPAVPYLMYDDLEAGDVTRFDQRIDRFSSIVSDLRQPQRYWIEASIRATRAMITGDFDVARDLIDRAREIGEPAAPSLAESDHVMFRVLAAREQGMPETLIAEVERISDQSSDDLFWQALLTVVASEFPGSLTPKRDLGNLIDSVERMAHDDSSAIVAGVLLSSVRAVRHDATLASRIYQALGRYGGYNAVLPNSRHFHFFGSISLALGVLAFATWDLDAAVDHLEDAIAMHRRMGAAPFLAHSLFEMSQALAQRGEDGDRATARGHLCQARETASLVGMPVLLARIERIVI